MIALNVIKYIELLKNQALWEMHCNPDKVEQLKKEYIKRIKDYRLNINENFMDKWAHYVNDTADNCIEYIKKF